MAAGAQNLVNITMPDGTVMQNVPYGTPKDQVLAAWQHLKGKEAAPAAPPKPAEEPSTLSQIERGASLVGRNAIEGAAALPDIVVNPANYIASKLTGRQFGNTADLANLALDKAGVPNPQPANASERYAAAGARGLGGAAAGIGAGAALAGAASPTVATVGRVLAENPGAQVRAATSGSAASQAAKDAGAGPVGQTLAGFAAGGAAGARSLASKETPVGALPEGLTKMRAGAVQRFHNAGFKMSPSSIPGNKLGASMEKFAGRPEVNSMLNYSNAAKIQELAAKAIGLPPGEEINPTNIQAAKAAAGKLIDPIVQIPALKVTSVFKRDIAKLGDNLAETARLHPSVANVDDIRKIQSDLTANPTMSGKVAVTTASALRASARKILNKNDGSVADASEQELAHSQMKAADAIEKMVETNVRATGNRVLYTDWLNGRKQYAIASDLENAMNPATGSIDARKLTALDVGGKRMSGPLRDIVDFQRAFPKISRPVEQVTPPKGITGITAGMVRPLAGRAALSNTIQNRLVPKP